MTEPSIHAAALDQAPHPAPDRRRPARLIGLAAAAVVTATSLLSPLPADALATSRPDPGAAKTDVDADLAETRADLDDLTAESAAAVVALQRTQTDLRSTRARLDAANAAVARSAAQVAQLRQRLAAARAQEEAGLRELAANAAATEAAQDGRDNLARVAYEGGGGARMALMFDVGSARDLAERAHLVETISSTQGAVIDDLDVQRRRALVVQEQLRETRREIAQLGVQTQAQLDRAQVAQADIAAATARLTQLAQRQARQQQALAARKNTEQRRLNTLQGESDRLAAVLKSRAERERVAASAQRGRTRESAPRTTVNRSSSAATSTNSTPRRAASGARLARPSDAYVSSPFGMRFHPVLHYSRLHAGMDFGAACGAPVYAAADGEVVRAGEAGGYGNQVVVDHGDSLATSYNHLSAIVVSGGWVQRGQLIGRVGTTGLSTGCHLHFEVRESGTPVDPAGFL